MEFENTLLYGIQKIPGRTTAEKHKYINVTAKEVASKKQKIEVSEIKTVTLSEPLEPLMRVEVAKVTNEVDLIVEALQTSEVLLCRRALQIPDLFPNEDSPLLNWDHFNNQLLSRISLTTRFKLIKKVSQDLQKKDPKYAENFFTKIDQQYGPKEALPLLLACSERFASEQLMSGRIRNLPGRQLQKLYAKYPDLMISYFNKTFLEEDPGEENTWIWRGRKNLGKTTSFIHNLMENRFDAMIGILENYSDALGRPKFGKRRNKTFLKKGTRLLIENPKLYLPKLSLEIVSSRLGEDEFSSMLANLLPKQMDEFRYFDQLRATLRYFSDEKRVSLTKEAFRKAYGKNLLDYPDRISSELLAILPKEERIRIAREKLKNDPDWNCDQARNSWRAYLPFKEVFEPIKTQIAKGSDPKERLRFLQLMIFNCAMNKDTAGLLEFLKYCETRHKNIQLVEMNKVINTVKHCFDLSELDPPHWDILIDVIRRMYLRGHTIESSLYVGRAITCRYYNDLDIDEYVGLLLKFDLLYYIQSDYYDIFGDLNVEGLSLRKLIDMVESHSFDRDYDLHEAVRTLFLLINKYNDKLKKGLKKKRQVDPYDEGIDSESYQYARVRFLFSCVKPEKSTTKKDQKEELQPSFINLDDHPLFLKFVEETILPLNSERVNEDIEKCTKVYFPHLFKKWFPNAKEAIVTEELSVKKLICHLKKDHSKVLQDLSQYYNKCLTNMSAPEAILFVKLLRWYDQLPVEFLNLSIEEIRSKNVNGAAQILALLIGGRKFEDYMYPLVSAEPNLDPGDKDSKQFRILVESFLDGAKLANPPVSLEKLFSQNSRKALFSVVSRTPLPTVLEFSSGLTHERVGVSKLMIEMLCMVAPIDEKARLFNAILNEPRHSSIHNLVLKKVLTAFTREPNEHTWNLAQKCLQVRAFEDPKILRYLCSFKVKPNQYTILYLGTVFRIVGELSMDGQNDLRKELMEKLFKQFQRKEIGQILPEVFQRKLVQEYIFESVMDKTKPSMDFDFVLDVILCNDDSGEKTEFLLECIEKFVRTYFGVSVENEKDGVSYPADKFFRQMVEKFVRHECRKGKKVNMKLVNGLQELFKSVLKPWQDVSSYLWLDWMKAYDRSFLEQKEFFIYFATNLHVWISQFGAEFLDWIKKVVLSFMEAVYADSLDINIFLESLLEVKNDYSCFCAASVLCDKKELVRKEMCKFDSFLEKLESCNHPTVQTILYELNFEY